MTVSRNDEKSAAGAAATLSVADWTKGMRPSMLYRLARLFGGNPDLLSFAGGAPAPDLCPTEALAEAANWVMRNNSRALQYGGDLPELKAHIQRLMSHRGVDCEMEQITITAGGQHAMDILTRLFLNPKGRVMIEEIVYTGIQQSVMPFEPDILSIPIDPAEGLDLDEVEAHLEGGAPPAFLYTIPEAHNPAGVTLPGGKRARLAGMARAYRFPVLEDDAYGFLNYESDTDPLPTLRAMSPEQVIYMGTFSKILAPGLRLGWIVAPAGLIPTLEVLKQLTMLVVAPLSQHITTTYLDNHDILGHIEGLQREYRARRDAMLAAMNDHFPSAVRWTEPTGGMFVWARLPEGCDTEPLVYRAVEEANVAFIPGKAFVTDPGNTRYDRFMRMSFAKYRPETIYEGTARLGKVLGKMI